MDKQHKPLVAACKVVAAGNRIVLKSTRSARHCCRGRLQEIGCSHSDSTNGSCSGESHRCALQGLPHDNSSQCKLSALRARRFSSSSSASRLFVTQTTGIQQLAIHHGRTPQIANLSRLIEPPLGPSNRLLLLHRGSALGCWTAASVIGNPSGVRGSATSMDLAIPGSNCET